MRNFKFMERQGFILKRTVIWSWGNIIPVHILQFYVYTSNKWLLMSFSPEINYTAAFLYQVG